MNETPHPPIRRQLPSGTVVKRIDTTNTADCPLAVVAAVAAALDRGLEELPPLASSIDPDMIEYLFRDDPAPWERSLSFYYAGHDVIVDSGGVVRVVPVPSPGETH